MMSTYEYADFKPYQFQDCNLKMVNKYKVERGLMNLKTLKKLKDLKIVNGLVGLKVVRELMDLKTLKSIIDLKWVKKLDLKVVDRLVIFFLFILDVYMQPYSYNGPFTSLLSL